MNKEIEQVKRCVERCVNFDFKLQTVGEKRLVKTYPIENPP